MKNIISGIYKILNTQNGHQYIGSAADVHKRWNCHRSDLQNNKHHSIHLQNAWNKYKSDCFEFSIVETCPISELIEREEFYLKTQHHEYNIAPHAGSNLGAKHSVVRSLEHRAKISAAHKGKRATPETLAKMSAVMKGRFIGRKISIEQRLLLSVALKGNKNGLGCRSPEFREKMSAVAKNRSSEHLAKIVASNTGKKRSPESCANNSAAQMGHEVSLETRTKISKFQKGKIVSAETRLKMSAARKKHWQLVREQIV